MKKFAILTVGLCLMLFAFIGYQHPTKHAIDPAKLMEFNSAKEVIDNSALIVKVRKISEKPVAYDLGNGGSDRLTLTEVEIEKVIKPMEGKVLNNGDKITIVEAEYADSKTGIIHHIENYMKMVTNKKYTLYLGYNKEVDNYYVVGLLYGKIPEDTKEKLFYGDMSIKKINEVISDFKKKEVSE